MIISINKLKNKLIDKKLDKEKSNITCELEKLKKEVLNICDDLEKNKDIITSYNDNLSDIYNGSKFEADYIINNFNTKSKTKKK